MCDIWKGNNDLHQLTEKDIKGLLVSFKKLDVKRVVMSGGEALLNPNFFSFCQMLQKEKIKVSLLTTGLTIKKHAALLVKHVHDIIISLDGDEQLHDEIRNIPGAFNKIRDGVKAIYALNPGFRVTGRTVIHKMNYLFWPKIIDAAKEIGLKQVSFLPADVSSHAFNREVLWNDARQHEILLSPDDVVELKNVMDNLLADHKLDFVSGYIAENPEKIKKIHQYYGSFYGLNALPYKKCNAPWVSVVIEADGTVRPCFFLDKMGTVNEKPLMEILNSEESIAFRKNLDVQSNETCVKCVCYLNLTPRTPV
jgi:MoaA/NifB/PqqE/SkfB family radical SAM enzyme